MTVDSFLRKSLRLIKRLYEYKLLIYVFFGLSVISCIWTYCFFYDVDLFIGNSRKIIFLLYTDVVCVLAFLLIVGNKLSFIWKDRHKKGSRFGLKLIAIFSFISVIPAALLSAFSIIFFHNGFESWFNERNQTVLRDSLNVANSYLDENKNQALNDSIAVSRVLEAHLNDIEISEENEPQIKQIEYLLDDLCSLKGISSAIVVDSENRIIAHTKYSVGLHFLNIKDEDLQKLRAIADQKKNGLILDFIKADKPNSILSAVCFRLPTQYIYLITQKDISLKIVNNVDNAKQAYSDYFRLLSERNNQERAFVLIFFIIGMLILTISIALAIFYSWELLKPIGNLIDVSEAVMGGQLSARADIVNLNNEISDLTRTFNQMLTKIHKQQDDLVHINRELDGKVKFITSVLSGVSSGVIGLDHMHVDVWNKKAEELLGREIIFGGHIFNVFPEIEDMINEIDKKTPFVAREIHFRRNHELLLFYVKITSIVSDEYTRYVITFDDLTAMVEAQHKSAWSEVARRVAHEIKNPLTPIQLSAERLHRKYISQISKDSDTFTRLTEVIVRQVADIKRLIDEFNFFARLPEPKFKKCDLAEICSQVVLLMNSDKVEFISDKETAHYYIKGDEQLIHRCVFNIIKNALNALATQQDKTDQKVWITLYAENDKIHLDIEDNGPGFPKDKMDSLTTPYFTMLPKGTGLGLAIVKKIVQDHGGCLSFGESKHDKGARVSLTLPMFMDKEDDK